MIRSPALAILLLIAGSANVLASDVDGLYAARVPVADRSEAELAQAIGRALDLVLVKLTGTGDAPRKHELRPLRKDARRFIEQFGYVEGSADGTTSGLSLRVQFDAQALNGELRRRGLVVWGKERPDTLVWLVLSDTRGRRMVGAGDAGELPSIVEQAAAARGIPVMLPVPDAEQREVLALEGTWASLSGALIAGSARYPAESLLIGFLRQTADNVWEGQWLIKVRDESLTWSQEGDIPALMVEESIGMLADALGRRFADPVLYAQAADVDLVVHGVRSVEDYVRVQSYLASLNDVSKLAVTRVAGDTVAFKLATRGGSGTLAQNIRFGKLLAPLGGTGAAYQLLPR